MSKPPDEGGIGGYDWQTAIDGLNRMSREHHERMKAPGPEDVDIEFNAWFNRTQPFMAIAAKERLKEETWTEIKTALKQAWIAAYAAGAASEAARVLPR